jgi:hypothetical protein
MPRAAPRLCRSHESCQCVRRIGARGHHQCTLLAPESRRSAATLSRQNRVRCSKDSFVPASDSEPRSEAVLCRSTVAPSSLSLLRHGRSFVTVAPSSRSLLRHGRSLVTVAPLSLLRPLSLARRFPSRTRMQVAAPAEPRSEEHLPVAR